ncbi:MAG: 5-formyltetrahydrofolate cyclo-ligase [Actinomycetota bacterium]
MSPRRHDHDAGGDPELLAAKADLRTRAWDAIVAAGAGRFPAPHHRIPNFVGAEAAAEQLRSLPAWRSARTIKANPDSPQWPVRQRALEDGKTVFMAVPRLAEDDPFFLLDPEELADTPRKASSIKGASRSARTVSFAELEPVDLVVTGCVAVSPDGGRLGKGGGFSDLEYAIAWEAGLIGPETVVVTTVHDAQVVGEGDIPLTDHDIRLDHIVTPDRIIDCPTDARPPVGIRWDELTDEKIGAIPVLRRLAELRR